MKRLSRDSKYILISEQFQDQPTKQKTSATVVHKWTIIRSTQVDKMQGTVGR